MKHLLLTALLSAGMATLLSCNNGDYLADPQGSIPTPPGLNGDVEQGVITCSVDSAHKYYRYGVWADMTPTYVLSGMIVVDQKPVEAITITIANYIGTGSYTISDTSLGNGITINRLDEDTVALATYVARDGDGYATITVKEAGGTIKGEFGGLLYRLDSTGVTVDRKDSVFVRDGHFNLGKK